MKLLNIGCGNNYNKKWTNIDLISNNKDIIKHDIRKGLPFKSNTYDMLYSSHVLEHLSKTEGESLLRECYRVLKPTGIFRVAVPDLENIAKEYLNQLNKLKNGDETARFNHEWMTHELIDQLARSYTGGEMYKAILDSSNENESFIKHRIGAELSLIKNNITKSSHSKNNILTSKILALINRMCFFVFKKHYKYYLDGKFRNSGEVHKTMYDAISLIRKLTSSGFSNIKSFTAFESNLENWKEYELDSIGEQIRKPDSIYIEGIK